MTAPTELVAAWRAEIEAIAPSAAPCPGSVLSYWPKVRAGMLDFLGGWGDAAVALGWTDTRLFGVHRLAGMYRVDSCGALILVHPYVVGAIDTRDIHFTNGLVHTGMTNPAESVPLWEFVKGARAC